MQSPGLCCQLDACVRVLSLLQPSQSCVEVQPGPLADVKDLLTETRHPFYLELR